jgi:hypothetical protein
LKMSLMQALIQGLPECIAAATLSWVILKNDLYFRKIALIGLIQLSVLYFLRLMPLQFGVHPLLGIISLAVLLTLIARTSFVKSLIVALCAIVILGIAEMTILPYAARTMDIPIVELFETPGLIALVGLPQVILLFLLAFLVFLYKNKKRKRDTGKNIKVS